MYTAPARAAIILRPLWNEHSQVNSIHLPTLSGLQQRQRNAHSHLHFRQNEVTCTKRLFIKREWRKQNAQGRRKEGKKKTLNLESEKLFILAPRNVTFEYNGGVFTIFKKALLGIKMNELGREIFYFLFYFFVSPARSLFRA